MSDTVCVSDRWPERLVSIHQAARSRFVSAEILANDRPIALLSPAPDTLRLVLPTQRLDPSVCLRVTLDLGAPAADSNGCSFVDGVRLCATSSFLLFADPPSTLAERATFATPGLAMSPVFGGDGSGLGWVDERSRRFVGYAAFGRLTTRALAVPGGCARLTTPTDSALTTHPFIESWVRGAARAAAQIHGVSSARDAVITAVAVPGQGPVAFGITGRGTAPSILLFVGARAGPELEADWTLVHEFVHLAMPYVPAEDAWLSEGFATYYQEVLRARAGMQSPEAAWRALDEGFSRGRRSGTGRSLRDESRRMHATRAFSRVYWAGAAIALLFDVALRTQGRGSLDARLAPLATRRDETMTALEVVRALDEDGALTAIAERWVASASFPDLDEAYVALGLVGGASSGDGRALGMDAERSNLRDAIMRPLPSIAPDGPCRTDGH